MYLSQSCRERIAQSIQVKELNASLARWPVEEVIAIVANLQILDTEKGVMWIIF